LLDYMIFHM